MDAVEAVMREEGYAALSARNIARHADLNYQLVFYYFSNLDDLLVAAYRRRTQRFLALVEQALAAPQPLHALWQIVSNPIEASLSLEYMAMASHKPVIHAETLGHVERMLAMFSAVEPRWRASDATGAPALSPHAVGLMITIIGSCMGFQTVQGLQTTLTDAHLLMDWCLEQLEPSDRAASEARQDTAALPEDAR